MKLTFQRTETALMLVFFYFCGLQFSLGQAEKTAQPERPKFSSNIRSVSVPQVDNIVTQSFAMLNGVDLVGAKIEGIKMQLKEGVPDVSKLMSQLDECTGGLTSLGASSPALVEELVNMVANIKDLHVPLLRVPLALKNLNDARKAVQYCIAYSKFIITDAVPNIKRASGVSANTAPVVAN